MDNSNKHLNMLIERYPALEVCRNDITEACNVLVDCFSNGNKLLIAGNGGSAADAEHIVGELMKSFVKQRPIDETVAKNLISVDDEFGTELAEQLQGALPAIALDGHFSLTTAFMNDVNPLLCFAQQVYGYGTAGDVLLGVSTSGNSKNVIYAAITAKAKGMKVIGLTGAKESRLSEISDVCIKVPETETYKVQEYHLPVYHYICIRMEERFFKIVKANASL